MNEAPIGVMDSGVGGLTVVSELWRQLPRESVLFYGDSARCPYGDRDTREIRAFTLAALDGLVNMGVKMLVIACNTATAVCLPEARARYDVPVIGVIEPGARAALAATRSKRIGVIGTRATVASGAYDAALLRQDGEVIAHAHACPGLVELVEQGASAPARLAAVTRCLAPLRDADIDTLILGCTHYPLLTEEIARVAGPSVSLISSAEEAAREVGQVLFSQGLQRMDDPLRQHVLMTSGDIATFCSIAGAWLQGRVSVCHADAVEGRWPEQSRTWGHVAEGRWRVVGTGARQGSGLA
ncbi:MAG: glutamate racemase [Firmicutes bacterium]|nr:glutamate racemase [Bacillota bacterium]